MSRIRSPNYPAISLATAIDRVRTIHKVEGRNSMTRETVAKVLGFSGLNGASATTVSALSKYGLMEALGDGESRVSDLAMRLLYPESDEDRRAACAKAAASPLLFREIAEKWPDRPPSDENLRHFLSRKSFGHNALDAVIRVYRETIDILSDGQGSYKEALSTPEHSMPANAEASAPQAPPLAIGHSAAPMSPPIADGKPFSVAFDGTLLSGTIAIRSAKEIDRLVRVLNAQKAAFEAMEDDDEAA